VDFVAEGPDGETFLIQSSAHVEEPGMWEREVRALVSASADYPEAVPLLLTYDSLPPRETLPAPIRWLPASAWLLGEEVAKTYEEE